MGLGETRREKHGLAKLSNRFVESSHGRERAPPAIMRRGKLRPQFHGTLKMRQRFRGLPGNSEGGGPVQLRVRIVGVEL
ncbi:MAG: hypothetical protein ABIZ81_12275, partial [Opitutaceae bacterium]